MNLFINALGVLTLTVSVIGFAWTYITLDDDHKLSDPKMKLIFLIFIWVSLAAIIYANHL